ncbi:ABC transporter ATP-binding protein [Desulfovibrio litoralis]|uniref:Putative ABC transport system ATP-binding protein n=1 Tax=Desulfovibrio litoralis DSM 11393 TaxID=1121455 RepID=A0A1M7SA99_9BACT|nr:ABC transporter ATP-binding protein [Desulfovibrio litoralis]SHN55426.1 putative ABC transport system ATP-binding protein [Desulfovibrio litoralis DSM 11393]
MPTLIEAKDITRTFTQFDHEITILKGINLNIDAGEFVAIQGSSGGGKSTLLHILGLLDRPSSGSLFLNGQNSSTLSDDEQSRLRNNFVGFVFQNFYLIPYATALENVLLPGIYNSRPQKESLERAKDLLEKVGLGDRMDFKPNRLSGGQQQRVAMARALLNNPPLILADEPTGQLDSKTSKEILQLLNDINKTGKTIVVVTHDPETASWAKRHIFMADGLITKDEINIRNSA